MGVESYPDQLEPENQDTAIWRFINMGKFRDLMETAELYFCRADLFQDEREGLPPEEYLATFGLHPLDVNDRRELLNHVGSDAQFREGFYVKLLVSISRGDASDVEGVRGSRCGDHIPVSTAEVRSQRDE